jgi:hypothetical protein
MEVIMSDKPTIHPADATGPEDLTHGQRITRSLFPEKAALQDQRLCIQCKLPKPDAERATWTPAGQREWNISGMCEPCFDRLFADENGPIFRRTPSFLLHRKPEALLTEGTYGDYCYFGGGRLNWTEDPEPVVFTLDHNDGTGTTTDETSCRPCFDTTLGAMVKDSLDSAEANGYELRTWPAGEVASDIGTYDGDLDQMPPSVMLPFVEKWFEGAGGAD